MRRWRKPEDPRQLTIDWTAAATTRSPPPMVAPRVPAWDFRATFPPVLPAAIEAGVLYETDVEPENLADLHAAHGAELRQTLVALERHHDARRRGVDPATGKVPRKPAKRDELPARIGREIERLERWWVTLLDTYAEAFGDEAAAAFGRHVQAEHAGIDLTADGQADAPFLSQQQLIRSPR